MRSRPTSQGNQFRFIVLILVVGSVSIVPHLFLCSSHWSDEKKTPAVAISGESPSSYPRLPKYNQVGHNIRTHLHLSGDGEGSSATSADVPSLKALGDSKQVDIYRTERAYLDSVNDVVKTEEITVVFKWRVAKCIDPLRSQPQLLFTALSNMPPVDVGIDIGACYGDTAVPMATHARTVLAFEPNPFSFPVLQGNVELNPQLNIIPYNNAVGEDKQIDLFYGGDHCNGGGWGAWKEGDSGEKKVSATSINLPRFLTENHPSLIPRIGFIKIDTEGFDGAILLTLQPLLAKVQPVLFVEWFALYHDKSKPGECSDGSRALFDAIRTIGYQPLDPTSKNPVKDCTNANWIPDIWLAPAGRAV